MLSDLQKQQRADRARTNGAKSKGAITPQGLERARTASLQHGLYAQEQTLSHTVDPVRYAQLRDDYHALWQPANRYVADKVDDLVAKRFYLDRLKAVHSQYMQEIYREFSGEVQQMELFVTTKENVLMRLETRIRQAELAMSRLERDILRLRKCLDVAPLDRDITTAGPSQKSAPPARSTTTHTAPAPPKPRTSAPPSPAIQARKGCPPPNRS